MVEFQDIKVTIVASHRETVDSQFDKCKIVAIYHVSHNEWLVQNSVILHCMYSLSCIVSRYFRLIHFVVWFSTDSQNRNSLQNVMTLSV